ncbi:MAG: hypothetical protein CM15mP74_37040 [Halieaceae bacterium]|nr:MAG: hypothetical protein CM15mP74_37040 [Halieaceae bacterium]
MRARDVAPQVQSLEHLRNYEMDCVEDPNCGSLPGKQSSRMWLTSQATFCDRDFHTLQRLTAITNEDPVVCAETTEALKATITVPTLRMNSMDLYVPFDRDDFDQAMDLIPTSVSAEWRDARDALAASEKPVDTTFAEWSLRRTGECMLRARRSRPVPIHRLAGAFGLQPHTELGAIC